MSEERPGAEPEETFDQTETPIIEEAPEEPKEEPQPEDDKE